MDRQIPTHPHLRVLKPALLCSAIAAASASAQPFDIYLNAADGRDHAACGDAAEPCRTIRYAVRNLAGPGDTLRLEGNAAFAPRGVALEMDLNLVGEGMHTTSLDAGGGERHFQIDLGASVTMQDVRLTNGNVPGSEGGAIEVVDGTLSVERVHFDGNEADSGGAVSLIGGMLESRYSLFSGNRANVYDGGAVSCWAGQVGNCEGVFIVNSRFTGNSAHRNGGGIYSQARTEIRRSELFENVANHGGAGYFGLADGSDVKVFASDLQRNEAGFGGALGFRDTAGVIRRSALIDNEAGIGGAVHMQGSDPADGVTVVNSTLSGNRADSAGAILGHGALYFTTLTDNEAPNVRELSGTFDIYRSLITHSVPDANNPNCQGVFGGSSNLVDDHSCGIYPAHNDDALLALRLRGGTTLSHGLESFSDAVGAADNCDGPNGTLGIDQRGAPRPSGSACDIGSFERQ